jgi:hypothetical protein
MPRKKERTEKLVMEELMKARSEEMVARLESEKIEKKAQGVYQKHYIAKFAVEELCKELSALRGEAS